MKLVVKGFCYVFLFGMVILALKFAQKLCWENEVSILNPPSLDSWDPTERVEAAQRLGQKWRTKR